MSSPVSPLGIHHSLTWPSDHPHPTRQQAGQFPGARGLATLSSSARTRTWPLDVKSADSQGEKQSLEAALPHAKLPKPSSLFLNEKGGNFQ